MMDPLYRFLPWDHVSLGQRLRQAREATMGLLLVAPPDSEVRPPPIGARSTAMGARPPGSSRRKPRRAR